MHFCQKKMRRRRQTRRKVVAPRSRRERVYKRIGEASEVFAEMRSSGKYEFFKSLENDCKEACDEVDTSRRWFCGNLKTEQEFKTHFDSGNMKNSSRKEGRLWQKRVTPGRLQIPGIRKCRHLYRIMLRRARVRYRRGQTCALRSKGRMIPNGTARRPSPTNSHCNSVKIQGGN